MPRLMAYCVSSAVVPMPKLFDMLVLWNSTVLWEILRMDAMSLVDRPSATNCRTSR